MKIIDVWESREHFDRFIETQIMPATQAVGATPEPPVPPEQYEVHYRFPD